MSLLDDAKKLSAERRMFKACTLALFLNGLEPDIQTEAIELLVDEDVDSASKHEVFTGLGLVLSSRALLEKSREGCRCKWCQENWAR